VSGDVPAAPHVRETLAALDRFIEREVAPLERTLEDGASATLEPDGRLSRAVWEARREVSRRSAEAGFYNLHLPERVGGGGYSRADMFFVEEAVYARGLGLTPAVLAWTEGPNPMLCSLSDEQRMRFLHPLMGGVRTAAFCLTEPGAGSDVLGIRTRAERDGDAWVITGHKAVITNAQYCDVAQVVAVTEPGAGSRSLSVFMVEADRPGFRRGATYRTIMDDGLTGEIFLDGVRVPETNVVGEIGQGLPLALTWINWRRMCRGGMCAGWGKFLLDRSCEYATARHAFGAPIGHLQAVQHMIADMYVDWYAARALSIAAQSELDRLDPYAIPLSPDAVRLVSLIKVANDEAFFRIADRAVQVHGAMGVMRDNPVERLFRIARNLRIPAGTDEIQKNQIARGLGLGSA
jgi:alkylation response protein AidB-like acyl-CoA dehydrogenase